ncbi:MAG: hypothetical protein K0S98_2286, partial [Propionibacteriaceae bacterium]|nr:hypothetical protein [Propionibacteriaceae bacterium]
MPTEGEGAEPQYQELMTRWEATLP